MDDIQNPSIEGSEAFVVFLSSPQGAVLEEPYEANVIIADTFQDSTYRVQTRGLSDWVFPREASQPPSCLLSSQHAV